MRGLALKHHRAPVTQDVKTLGWQEVCGFKAFLDIFAIFVPATIPYPTFKVSSTSPFAGQACRDLSMLILLFSVVWH